MRTDTRNPNVSLPLPPGIIRDRHWWIAILIVSDEITARNSSMQTTEAKCINGIWYPFAYIPK